MTSLYEGLSVQIQFGENQRNTEFYFFRHTPMVRSGFAEKEQCDPVTVTAQWFYGGVRLLPSI